MNRPIINVDLDGVVFDFVGAFGDFAGAYLEREMPRPTIWDFWDEWGLTKEEWTALFEDAVHDGIWATGGYVIPGAVEALQALSDREYHIRILTTRLVHKRAYDVAAEDTVKWLEMNQIPYRSLSFIGPGDTKANYEADVIIDDHVPNIDAFVRIPGRVGIVFDQPWNRDTTTLEEEKVFRARGWSEVLEVKELWPR